MEYGQEHDRLQIHLVLTGGITRADLEKLWGLGEVNADALRFEKDGLATLAKYLTKGGESDERPTWKRWSVLHRTNDFLLSQKFIVEICRKLWYNQSKPKIVRDLYE